MAGSLSRELEIVDAVLVRREPTVDRSGPTRFQARVYEGVYKIKRKISPTTFVVSDLVDQEHIPAFHQPLHAERLIKLDMPELDLSPDQPRRLEMRETPTQPWNEYVIERFGADGRVRLSIPGGAAQDSKWVDLSKCEYRWIG